MTKKKKKDLDKIIDQIHDEILKQKHEDLFSDGSLEYGNIECLCKKFLIINNYKVIDPIKYYELKSLDDLIHLFYNLRRLKYPTTLSENIDWGKDRSLAKTFVEKIMVLNNISKEEALQECGNIIRIIFEHEDKFNFESIPHFGLLGQRKLGWVTDKAIRILNNLRMHSKDRERDALIAKLERKYDAEKGKPFKNLNLSDILDQLKKEEKNYD